MTSSDAPAVVLQISGMRKSFGAVEVLRGLDLTVREGEVYGFLGKNGAGKTTCIRTVMGVLRGDEGALTLFGETVARPDIPLKQRIGYVSQEQNFYSWMSCRRLGRFVAGFYPTWDAKEFERLLGVLELPPKRKTAELSGGMRAKLALALSLSHRPNLLILDEPTAGLDPAARREFLELVRQQAGSAGRTTFFSTHIVEEVERVADRVGILDQGVLQYEGAVAELRAAVRRVAVDTEPTDGSEPLDGTEPPNGTAPYRPPDGFRLLTDEQGSERPAVVLMASPDAWDEAPFSPDMVSDLSLEDIFLSIVASKVPKL